MGSFINQCLASRQTVMEGAPCRVIPLIQQRPYHAANCTFREGRDGTPQVVYGAAWGSGLAAHWKPVMGFIEAIAGDRCGSELIHTNPNTQVQLGHLFAEMASRGAVSTVSERQDEGFSFEALCLAQAPNLWDALKNRSWTPAEPLAQPEEAAELWEALAEPFMRMQVFMADYGRVFRSVTLGVIHEEAYQWLLKEGEQAAWHGGKFNRVDYLDQLADEAYKLTLEMAKSDDDKKLGSKEVLAKMLMAETLRDGLRRISGDTYGNLNHWFRLLSGCIAEHVDGGKPLGDPIRQRLKSYLDDSYVLRALSLCNIPLAPMIYAGQDYDNECGTRYARLVEATSVAVNEQRRRACEE